MGSPDGKNATQAPRPILYLFASSGSEATYSPGTVFYKIDGESIAKSLCNLFTQQFSGPNGVPIFDHRNALSFSEAEQVFMEEALDALTQYDDPDRFIYDPPPSQHTINLAAWARRADKWEYMLRARAVSSEKSPESAAEQQSGDKPPKTDTAAPVIGDGPPQMSAEDNKNSGLAVLLLVAQAYYKLLESAVSTASWVSAKDLNLNQSYFWAITTLTNLLKNHDDLKDFPEPFEPAFPDLYPSTIRDTEWVDDVAPHADKFLSVVQRYVLSKGLHEPEQGSPAWCFIELFRPSVNVCVERANAYDKRMRQFLRHHLSGPTKGPGSEPGLPAPSDTAVSDSIHVPAATTPPAKHPGATAPLATGRNKVFLSYSHKDREFLNELVEHLKPLERDGRVSCWSDEQIRPGSELLDNVQNALSASRVAVLLVTSSFLASDFIDRYEIGPLLKVAETGGVTILWVLVRDCNWKMTALSRLRSAYPTKKPLAAMKAERDTAWVKICDAIVAAADGD